MARDLPGLLLRALAARHADGDRPSRRVFVLGGQHERRVNLPAQQARALNLAWALSEGGLFHPAVSNEFEHPVVVVGAGAGGLTFAAAVATLGVPVTVIDEHEEPMAT